ncbi:F-box domain-containing protein [Psidium guajava]|nr:F-box domain-containing protein [Psidium guajava]
MAENWADLLPELLELCSRRLLLEDWFAFRSVCSAWRAAACEERFDVPWLMLEDERSTECAEFRSLFSLRVHKVALPEVKGKMCFSSRGWIFTVHDSGIRMLNPLSRAANRYRDDIIKLPGEYKLTGRFEMNKFALSASPSSSPNYEVMVACWPYGPLGFWKPGNEEWKILTPSGPDPIDYFADVIHYQGQFVAVNSSGSILRCDPDGPDPMQVVVEMPPAFQDSMKFNVQVFLVGVAGHLWLVYRFAQPEDLWTTTRGFQVFSTNLDTGKWTKLESMGNVSLFVGFNSSFSVHVDENQHGIKPNCIYFTGFQDVGTYYMEDGRIEFDKKADITVDPPRWIDSPPLWIEPSF